MVKPVLTSRAPLRRIRGVIYPLLPLLPAVEVVDTIVQRQRVQQVAEMESEGVHLAQVPARAADVTVVIPTYKRPGLLSLAVASVAQQDFDGDLRVIVVDDAGGQVPDEVHRHALVDVVTLRTNIGVAGAVRNVGIRLTDSPLLAFLDDDNEWEPGHLSSSVAALSAHPEASASTTLFAVVDAGGHTLRLSGGVYDASRLRHGNYIDTSTIVLRRHPALLFSRLPRRRGSYRIEDWALVRAARRHGPVVHVPRATVRYREHGGSYFSAHGEGAA